MQRKIPSHFVCGSRDACLECMLPGIQVTALKLFRPNFFDTYIYIYKFNNFNQGYLNKVRWYAHTYPLTNKEDINKKTASSDMNECIQVEYK